MSETTADTQAVEAADTAPVTETAAPSIDDSLSAAFDRAQDDAPDEAAPEPDAQQRGPDGRFVSAEQTLETAPEQPEAAPQEPEQPAIPDYIAQYVPDFASRGIGPEKAIPYLLNTWRQLETNPEATLAWLANRYGMNISFAHRQQPQQAAPEPAADEWVDPQVAALRQEVEALKSVQAQQRQAAEAQQQQAFANAYGQVNNEIESFAKGKATDVTLTASNVKFDQLRPIMASFIQSGQADTLEQAYDMAKWSHPATRAAALAAERQQAGAVQVTQAAAKAAAARRAASVNVMGDTAAPAKPRTIDESLALHFDRAQAS